MGMRTIIESIPKHVIDVIQKLRRQLCDLQFSQRHRVRPEDFTRERQLTFPVVIQRHLHELLNELAGDGVFEPVTAGAWTHARAKLRHTAFIELNQTTVLPSAYGAESEPTLRRWRGHRLLGVDSSLLRLPRSPEMLETFGTVEVHNHLGATGTTYAEGRMSVLYDLLNRIGLDGRLESSRVGEVELAIEQLRQARPGDVLVNDRGFTGYAYLAWHHHLGLDYIARCSSGSFAAAQELFRMNRAGRSKTVRLRAPADQRAELRALGLPLELTVRFVSLRLPTGELEVLATSLLDEEQYPTEEFLNVYHCRWNHETFYGTMKGRLDLENFSGQSVEAVRQDFFATLLLCNLESVLTESAGQSLREQSAAEHHPKQVNHAVAFHALKDQLLELLYSELPIETVVEKLQLMFVGAPVSVRPKRKPPRKKLSMFRSYHFQRRVRKIVF